MGRRMEKAPVNGLKFAIQLAVTISACVCVHSASAVSLKKDNLTILELLLLSLNEENKYFQESKKIKLHDCIYKKRELFENSYLDNLFSTNKQLVILYSIGDAPYFIKKIICLQVKGGFLNVCSPSLRLEANLLDTITVTTPNGLHQVQ